MNVRGDIFRHGRRRPDVMLKLLLVVCAFISESKEKTHRLEHYVKRRRTGRRDRSLAVRARTVRHILFPTGPRSFPTAHIDSLSKTPRFARVSGFLNNNQVARGVTSFRVRTQRHNVFPLAPWLRPFHPVRMVGTPPLSSAADQAEVVAHPITRYPFPAEAGPALSPQVSRATFLGALNLLTGRSGWSSQMSPAGRFTHPGVTGVSSRSRVAIGSALPALSLFPHSVELM
jgi:hypothetical protein